MKKRTKGYILILILMLAIMIGAFTLGSFAVFADEPAESLTELNFTVTAPEAGETYDSNVVSAEQEKYTATFVRVFGNRGNNAMGDLSPEHTFQMASSYQYYFSVTPAEGYVIDSGAKIYLNGIEATPASGNYYVTFRIPINFTVEGGAAHSNANYNNPVTEITQRNCTVYLKADDAPEGKAFIYWLITRDGESYKANTSTTSLYTGEYNDISCVAVYGDILTEVHFTVTAPVVGATYDSTVASADPDKYTATLDRVYGYIAETGSNGDISAEEVFLHAKTYSYHIFATAAEGYAIDRNKTTVYINGNKASLWSGNEYYYEFKTPIEFSISGGKLYSDYDCTVEKSEVRFYEQLYFKADEAPAGKKFIFWKITYDGEVRYERDAKLYFYSYDYETLTAEAVFADIIDEVTVTIPGIAVGGKAPEFVYVSDKCTVLVTEWYYYADGNVKTVLGAEDVFEFGKFYYYTWKIIPNEGYMIDSSLTKVTLNGNRKYANSTQLSEGIIITNYSAEYVADLIPITVTVEGGYLMKDGVRTEETQFLAGTVLTVVVDEDQYPEGKVFRNWSIIGTGYVTNNDKKLKAMTFTLKSPSVVASVTFTPNYSIVSALYYADANVAHPAVGGKPSYETNVNSSSHYATVLGWYDGETPIDENHVFEAGKVYTVRIKATPAESYYFADPTKNTLATRNYFSGIDRSGKLIEYGEDGSYIIYEVSCKAKIYQETISVNVTTPAAGMKPDTTVTYDDSVQVNVSFCGWRVYDETKGWIVMTEGQLFEVGRKYRARIQFHSTGEYFIGRDTTFYINGKKTSNFSNGSTSYEGESVYSKGEYIEFTVEAYATSYQIQVDGGAALINGFAVTKAGGGVTVTIMANAPAPGKAFKEWQIVSGEGVLFASITSDITTFVMPAGDVSIKAVYRNTPHDITVTGGSTDTAIAGSGETVSLTASAAPTGYYFNGWRVTAGGVTLADASAKTTTFVMGTDAVTIEAIYEEQTVLSEIVFTVTHPKVGATYDSNIVSAHPDKYTATLDVVKGIIVAGGGQVEMSPTDKFITGEYYYYYFYVTIDEKYTTDSNTKITLNGERVWNYSGNKYYASLQPPYTVTVIGGTAYADNAYTTPVTDAFRYGRVYIKADPTPEGKVFIGWQVTNGSLYWYDTLSKENIIIEISNRDVELTALYADVFTITYTDGVDGEEIFADQVTDGQREGWTTPKFSGTPKRTGYTFAGWSPEVADKVTASVTYTALWTVNQYTITYTSDGNTINTVTYDYGATVTAPEDPTRTGYTFTGWDKTIPETMPASNLTIAATWQVNQYTITFNTEGGSAVTAITKNYGSSITAPSAPTREGYDFAGWDKEIPSTMPAENITITATWVVHKAAEGKHTCDYCGRTVTDCVDATKDHKCDVCGVDMNMDQHKDSATDGDHLCDYGCGATLEECSDKDGDGNHTCDVCGKSDATTHKYSEASCGKVATCTECGATTGEPLQHQDIAPKDHVCDHGCGKNDMGGAHEAASGSHNCGYCGGKISDCADTTPKDHKCDICGTGVGDAHEAAEGSHNCAYCGGKISDCADTTPKDHKCDVCGTGVGDAHEAAEGSHHCAYCGEKVTDCVSNADDGDCTTAITCSVCGEETTAANAAHTDTNTDGKCDACAKDMPTTPGTDDPNTGNTDEPKDDEGGLGTGAIVAIVVGSVLVVGIGGFALVWFVIKKKTWADFLAIFKKG